MGAAGSRVRSRRELPARRRDGAMRRSAAASTCLIPVVLTADGAAGRPSLADLGPGPARPGPASAHASGFTIAGLPAPGGIDVRRSSAVNSKSTPAAPDPPTALPRITRKGKEP